MKHWITRVMAAATVTVMALPASSETLGDALVSAYGHSGLLEQNRAVLRAADEDVAVAMAALRPVINWSASASRTWVRSNAQDFGLITNTANTELSAGISAELLLYDFGGTRLGVDVAKESVLATRDALISLEQQVLLRAVRAYMNVRRETENVALRQNNLRLLRQELRAARDRFAVGEVTRTDVALAEARLAGAEAELAAAFGGLEQARDEYAAAVGRKPGNLAPAGRLPRIASSEQAAVDIALRTHPDMSQAQRQVAIAELNILRAEAAMKPRVTLQGRVGVSDTSDPNRFSSSGSISLNAGGPIYQGGRLSALVRQAQAGRDAQRGALHNTRHNIRLNVGQTWALLHVARASREASEAQVRAANVAFRGVREEATLGARTTLDVLDAEQELLDARTRVISARVDEYIAAYTLLSTMGLLTVEHLKLPVQQYDPAAYYNLVKDAPVRSKQGAQLDRVLESLGKK
ncbi:TolC family outer membrane protein [Pseudaestuariivita sp.]|uniref:TolC family outer membrane protein n=1 Tax=Pseudaestuariivita sp. TaxID=2211669 RepID=UPI0040583E3C